MPLIAVLSALLFGLVAGIFAYAAGRQTPCASVGCGAAVMVAVLTAIFAVLNRVDGPRA